MWLQELFPRLVVPQYTDFMAFSVQCTDLSTPPVWLMLFRVACSDLKISLPSESVWKSRMSSGRLGVAHTEFILSGFPSLMEFHTAGTHLNLLEPSWSTIWMGLFIDTGFSSTRPYLFCCAVSVSRWELGMKNHCLFLLPQTSSVWLSSWAPLGCLFVLKQQV